MKAVDHGDAGEPRRRSPVIGVHEARALNAVLAPHRDALATLHERIAVARAMASRAAGANLLDALRDAQAAFEDDVVGLPDPRGMTGDLRRAYGRAIQSLSDLGAHSG
jgi:hypothetical protein